MVTQKGLDKDPDLAKKVDKAIFPGFQGGPHMHQVAAIAVCLKEASTPAFKKYAHQIVKNAKALAEAALWAQSTITSGFFLNISKRPGQRTCFRASDNVLVLITNPMFFNTIATSKATAALVI